MDVTTITEDLLALLEQFANDTGAELTAGAVEIAQYAAERAAHLATLVGQPGFNEAVAAERDNVQIFASISALENAQAADARLTGLLDGALKMAARGLFALL